MKVKIISKLPTPTSVGPIRPFFRHARFYRRFIKDFNKISQSLCNLLAKDTPFVFDDNCAQAFHTLRTTLTTAPIIKPPDWSPPFEIMCDASDFAIDAMLGQRANKEPHVIYYASKIFLDV